MICSECGIPQGTHGIDGGTGMCWSCRERTAATHEAPPLCAAGPWNYDMDAAPRDGTRVLLAWGENPIGVRTMMYRECDEYINVDFPIWTDGDGGYINADTPFAWANINTPEVPK